jgi:hypothetical protein
VARQAPLLGSWLVLAGLTLGCASARPALEPSHGPSSVDAAPGDGKEPVAKARPKPPTPESVTVAQPGGDAEDPQQAALFRQIDEAWGQRSDRDNQLLVPLPDSEHWKRVRYWGVEHFVGFRYGKDHHALAVGFVQEVPAGTPVNTDTCMRRFEAWGRPQTKPFDVKFGPFNVEHQRWHDQRLDIHTVDGSLALGFSTTSFSAAWAAYPAYPDACLIFAIAVPWRDHPELAKQVRDRWVKEGFVQMAPQTPQRAVRNEE